MPGWFPEWFIEIETDMNGDIQQLDEPLEGAAEVVDEIPRRLQSLLQMPVNCCIVLKRNSENRLNFVTLHWILNFKYYF